MADWALYAQAFCTGWIAHKERGELTENQFAEVLNNSYENSCIDDFPKEAPRTKVEKELANQWRIALSDHQDFPSPETWQRRIAATAAYKAVYEWNRAK